MGFKNLLLSFFLLNFLIYSIHSTWKTLNNNNNNNNKASNFKWGTATASYQIEGAIDKDGRLPSIWDTFCETTNKVYKNESGEIADDDYDKFEEDLQLMVNLSIKHYRFSIAWPRILPDGININMKGIEHYQTIINLLKQYNIEPFVTLYHWDLPQNVYDITNGGWINSSIINYFTKYAQTVFDYFHNDIDYWLTFNEPWTFCVEGYGIGSHAPGRCSDHDYCPIGGNSSTEPYLCAHNVLLSHGYTVQIFRNNSYYNNNGKSKIGITLNGNWAVPMNNSQDNIDAVQRNLIWQLGWFANPVWYGDYPNIMKQYIGSRLPNFTIEQSLILKGSYDFFGLNHYTTYWVADYVYTDQEPTWFTDQQTYTSGVNYNGTLIGPQADSSWLFVVPYGIYYILNWIWNEYQQPIIFVTENGVDCVNESSLPIEVALNDTFRVDYYKNYINYMLKAYNENINVQGYFAWSLMDNFEWADGYNKRFGLHYVDYNSPNLTRYQKQSALWYSSFIQNNPFLNK